MSFPIRIIESWLAFMGFSLVVVFASVGIALSLLVIPLLLSQPYGDRRANRFLAGFVAILALMLFNRFVLYSGVLEFYPAVGDLGRFLYFALAPLLYFYICALTSENFVLSRQHYWHFLPVAVAFFAVLPIYFIGNDIKRGYAQHYLNTGLDSTSSLSVLSEAAQNSPVIYIYFVLFVGLSIHLALYSLIGLQMIGKHRRRIGEQFSNTDRIRLRWVRVLCSAVLLMCVVSVVWLVLFIMGYSAELRSMPILVTSILIYGIGLMSLRQPVIYARDSRSSSYDTALPGHSAEQVRKYRGSGLAAADCDTLWERLTHYMDSSQAYLVPGLTIGQLSETLDVPAAHLSQVINTYSESNFFDFVNGYRVRHAKGLIRDQLSSRTKLLTIALDAGFNSQSTFYAQFKKHCGETPAQFRQSLIADLKAKASPVQSPRN